MGMRAGGEAAAGTSRRFARLGPLGTRARSERGQATVELAAVIPVVLIVAVVTVNALGFFGACASFDRVARQAICLYGAAPDAGEGPDDVVGHVEEALREAVGAANVSVAVSVESTALGLERYTARIEFAPTLFGLGLRSEVFGVLLPQLRHEVSLVVDRYRPGMVF